MSEKTESALDKFVKDHHPLCRRNKKGCWNATCDCGRDQAAAELAELHKKTDCLHPNNSRNYLVVLKNYLAVHLLRGTSTYACALQEAQERAGEHDTEYLVLEVLEDVTPEMSH